MNQINILYFARLREAFQREAEQVELSDEIVTVQDLTRWLAGRGADWAAELSGQRVFRVAINQEMAYARDVIPPGAEVAIFPPVTGG